MPGKFGLPRRGARLRIAIDVTADDIASAVRGSSTRNPLAVAMMRQLSLTHVYVTRTSAYLEWSSPGRDIEVVGLPFVARMFLIGFERSVRVRPLRFRLTVTAVDWHPFGLQATESALPPSIWDAALRVREHAEELVDRHREFLTGSKELFVVKRVLEAYLPEALAGYLMLHEAQRDQPIAADGRTGREVVMHELALIEKGLDEITDKLDRRRAARLLEYERSSTDRKGKGLPSDPSEPSS
jgi:hypothetical protein